MVSVISLNKLSLIEMGAVLLIFGLLSFLLHRFACRRKNAAPSWKVVEKIVHLPLQMAIWAIASSLLLDLCSLYFGFERLGVYAKHLAQGFAIFCLGWLALRFSQMGFARLKAHSSQLGMNSIALEGLRQLVSAVIVLLTLLLLFQIFGLNILPLLAFGGIGVAGITLAAQDILSNFFGGIILHVAPTFSLGDLIELPAHHIRGEVEQVGWYGTFLRDAEKRQIFFPNSLFTKTPVVNLSRSFKGQEQLVAERLKKKLEQIL